MAPRLKLNTKANGCMQKDGLLFFLQTNRTPRMGVFYESLFRPVLFKQDPERAHDHAIMGLRLLGRMGPLTQLVGRLNRAGGERPIKLFGLDFPNAVGLAAGFDKNGLCLKGLEALGFGHLEIGTVTAQKQPGNPRPRLFRYPEAEALVNRYGFPNDGAEAVAQRLMQAPARGKRRIPIGVNIGKSKMVPIEEAVGDYLASFNAVADYADYVAINVSSPNTPELRQLQAKQYLPDLLGALRKTNQDRARKMGTQPLPLLLKISPDITFRQLDDIIQAVTDLALDGIIATNTTTALPEALLARDISGGLSGRPLLIQSTRIIKYIQLATGGKLPVIGVGGVVDAFSAGQLMDAGASLVQIYTGLVYRGPGFVRDVAQALSWHQRDWI